MFKIKNIILVMLFLFFVGESYSQHNFIIKNNKHKYVLPFKFLNNLVIIPVTVNGEKLSFILDTGVSTSIIFNLNFIDSIELKNVKKVRLRGLGEGNYIEALQSENNKMEIGDLQTSEHTVFLILDKGYDLSSKMGFDIHGIIGGDILKDFIVSVNYTSKKLVFYNPKYYKYKSCNKCQTLPLEFNLNKPYIMTRVTNKQGSFFTKLLVDSGGSDALWLFLNTNKKINLPVKFFDDYLGQGLNGSIYGKRARIKKLEIGNFYFDNLTVAYPDSTSIVMASRFKDRNGTLGAEILKRFHIIYDYPNQKITLRKNNRYFKDKFNYNLSGIELSQAGKSFIKVQKETPILVQESPTELKIGVQYNYIYSLKPTYRISEIRKNSPAQLAGLRKGDILLEINHKPAYEYTLQEIMQLLHSKEGKTIKMLVDRNGINLKYQFKLKKLL